MPPPRSPSAGYPSAASTTVTVAPAGAPDLDAGCVALRGSRQDLEEICVEQGHDRLRLGIAEAAVELENARAVRGQHESGVQQPDEGRATRRELGENGGVHRFDETPCLERSYTRDRRVRTHAARVRPLVAVEGALEVLRGYQRQRVVPVADREERDLRAFEELLHDDVAGRAGL